MILIDHCVPRRYLRLLTDWGYPADLMSNHIKPDSDDPAVIELAQALDAVLLTADLDFSSIMDYPPANYVGIIVIRYTPENETQLDAALQQALQDHFRENMRGTLFVITPGRYRLRRE